MYVPVVVRPEELTTVRTTRPVLAAALLAFAVVVPAGATVASDDPGLATYISEIHYDNVGTDVGEAIEVTGPADTDLAGWSIVLYNGSNGAAYGTNALTGVLGDQGGGVGTTVVDYPTNGIQNGSPDGVALVDAGGSVVQFVSYEGQFTAVGGPADGLVSTDIGVEEGSSTLIGQSLQRSATGVWTGPVCASFGMPNDPAAPEICPIVIEAEISEIHYDNVGTDVGEAIEVVVTADADLTGWSVVLYNGSNGLAYRTDQLSGTVADLGGGVGVYVIDYPTNGIQNGSPDGVALVGPDGVAEFLSYEGTFVAVDGPAAGMTSVDIGVFEPSDTPIGLSLQQVDGVWSGPKCASFGQINDPAAPAECPQPPTVFLSELHYDNVGADVNEGVEVQGPAGSDLTGWNVVLYNGSNGLVYDTVALSGMIPDLGGGVGVVAVPIAGIQNGSPDAIALVDAGGAVVEFLGYEGTFTAIDGPAMGLTSVDMGVAEDGSTLADQSLQRVDFVWSGPKCASFGELNDPLAPTFCPIEVKIHEVQGSGATTPLAGRTVIIEGVVTNAPDTDADGVAETFGGFYVQEEDADADADPLTSEGIFVFSSGNVPVAIGDLVRVTGTAVEFGGLTEITNVTEIDVIGTAPLPTPVHVTFPLAPGADLEPYEGMLVTLPQTLVVSEYFNYDRFGEVVVALPPDGHDRPMVPTAVYDEDSQEAADLADLNDRSRITIDDGFSSQNPSTPVHPINRELFSLTNAFRGGDTVSGLTGPLHFAFGLYRMMPLPNGQGYSTYEQTTAPAAPDAVGGDLRVASLNALNYFVTLDDGSGSGCGPDLTMECRGADANQPNELARQRVKLINTLVGLDADVIGLNEVENSAGVEALADLVDGLNDVVGAGTYDYIAAGTDGVVGTDAIKVGLLYRTTTVAPFGDEAVLDTPEFLDPNNSGSPKNRAAVAQTFVEVGSGEVFSVVVNHLKSKGSGCGPGDDHPLAGSCNVTRTLAAQLLAEWIDTDPTGVADDDWLIIGDLNSYDQEAPIDVLRDAGYTDLIGAYQGPFAYSYVFDGEFGYLDYAMSSPSMTAQVTGATEWHINADEPDIFDYDTSFKSAYQATLFDPTTPYRSSDHDAVLVGLSLAAGFDATVTPDPSMIWPPNHTLRPIDLITAEPGLTATVISATSSEADSGLGDDDVPNDIVITDGSIEVRAERYAIEGRTYTIEVTVTDGSQIVVVDDVTVVVLHDQRDRWVS
jgi:uncharacterized protein